MEKLTKEKYWQSNLLYLIIFLCLWLVIALLIPITFADYLNQFALGGLPLGFWFSTQGSLISLVVLLIIYSILMNRLDTKFKASHQE